MFFNCFNGKSRIGLNLLLVWCLVAVASALLADVRLPAIVGDNMMLQQQMGAPIWGWANPGERVTVAGSWGKSASATAGDNGKWKVCLETPSHGGPYTLTIKGKNEITINNVMIWEVWLCAGQSNIGWRLSATFDGREDSASANYPNFRIFRSERRHSPEPQEDCTAQWIPCSPETAATCSAVSFYFARKLHQELRIPVGIVLQPYAGTPIEGWMPKEIQMDDRRTRKIVEEMDAESAAYDKASATKQLERALESWKQGKRRGKPRLRTPSNWGHQYPGNIFNGMIYPFARTVFGAPSGIRARETPRMLRRRPTMSISCRCLSGTIVPPGMRCPRGMWPAISLFISCNCQVGFRRKPHRSRRMRPGPSVAK